jgi:hypothetical protein
VSTSRAVVQLEAPTIPRQRRRPPYAREIEEELAAGRQPNCIMYAGAGAWNRAAIRRARFGVGSALVVPSDMDPVSVLWPALDAAFVDARGLDRAAGVRLGATLIAAGVRFASMLLDHDSLSFSRAECGFMSAPK